MPNPILKVLSTLSRHRAAYLLMGGQACVLYGAAEFSRDTDIAVLDDSQNLDRLSQALDELQAECVALPPFERDYLERGHAVHFRCRHPEALGMRVDIMSMMRGVAPFAELWERRTSMEYGSAMRIEVMGLPDLVRSKKTQRDKDWPMIRRVLEAHFLQHRDQPNPEQLRFWLRESRTPAMLMELAERFPDQLAAMVPQRPLLAQARSGDEGAIARGLETEERQEREADRLYWLPLRRELEQLRHRRRESR